MIRCPQCGKPYPVIATYCLQCGASLKGSEAPPLDPEEMPSRPDDGDRKPESDKHPGGLRPILQLVLKDELVPDGSSVGIEHLAGDERGKKERMQPLRPSTEKIVGYLCENTTGDLVYESMLESRAGNEAAESLIAFASDENRRFPAISKADHAVRAVGSTGNMMRNPTWEHIT